MLFGGLAGESVGPGVRTAYYFEYGASSSYGEHTKEVGAGGSGTSEVQETQAVNGLAEGTTYHFRIVAINLRVPNGAGVIYGADQTFSTGAQPAVLTGAPTGVGPADATLNGTINPHGTEVKYYFEYGGTPEYGLSTAQASAGSGNSEVQVSQTLAGLSPNTIYHCRLVAAYNSIKTYGADATFTTAPLAPLAQVIGPAPVPNETPLPPAAHKTPSPPSVQYARQSAKRWRESNRLARISRAKTPTGTTFSFSLNEQATVSFSFAQLLGGPQGAHSCLAKTHENVERMICNTVMAGTLSFTGHSGTNSVLFAGRISHTNKRISTARTSLHVMDSPSSGWPQPRPCGSAILVTWSACRNAIRCARLGP